MMDLALERFGFGPICSVEIPWVYWVASDAPKEGNHNFQT